VPCCLEVMGCWVHCFLSSCPDMCAGYLHRAETFAWVSDKLLISRVFQLHSSLSCHARLEVMRSVDSLSERRCNGASNRTDATADYTAQCM
jgi:hypothetical protein